MPEKIIHHVHQTGTFIDSPDPHPLNEHGGCAWCGWPLGSDECTCHLCPQCGTWTWDDETYRTLYVKDVSVCYACQSKYENLDGSTEAAMGQVCTLMMQNLLCAKESRYIPILSAAVLALRALDTKGRLTTFLDQIDHNLSLSPTISDGAAIDCLGQSMVDRIRSLSN